MRRTRRSAGTVVALSLLLASCGLFGESNEQSRGIVTTLPTTAPDPTTTTEPPTGPGPTTIPSTPSPPLPHVQPPANIDDRYLGITPLAGFTAALVGPAGGVVDGLVFRRAVILGTAKFGLVGFIPNESVVVLLQGPDGFQDDVEGMTDEEGEATITWTSGLEATLGTYTVTASQGDATATDTFELVDRPIPTSLVVPSRGPADATFEVVFYKFPPGDDLSIFLYRVLTEVQQGGETFATYGYVATLAPSAVTDGEGTLVFPIEGVPLSEGGYCIFYAEPEDTSLSHGCIRFDVES